MLIKFECFKYKIKNTVKSPYSLSFSLKIFEKLVFDIRYFDIDISFHWNLISKYWKPFSILFLQEAS